MFEMRLRKALRDPRVWKIMAFMLAIRAVPLAIGVGVAFAIRDEVGGTLAGVIAAATFLASTT